MQRKTRGPFHIPALKGGPSDTFLRCLSTTVQSLGNNQEQIQVNSVICDKIMIRKLCMTWKKGHWFTEEEQGWKKEGNTTWLHKVSVWRHPEMTEFGILRKPGKATGKDLGLPSVGFGVVKQWLPRTSWGRATKVMSSSCGTQQGGTEAGMDAQHWIGLAKTAEKGYR